MLIYYWLIAILPLVNHPLWGAKVGPLTIFEYLGVLSLMYAIVHVATKNKIGPLLSGWETRLFVLLYVVAFLSSLIMGRGIDLKDGPFIMYTSSLMLVLMTLCVVDTIRRLRYTIAVVIGGYALASLYVIREWQKLRGSGIDDRPGWIVGDANYFATASVCAIALAFYGLLTKRPFKERAFCLVCLLIILFANTACASRGGFLGLIAASLVLTWETKHKARNLILITAFVLPLSLLMPLSPLHRFLNPKADRGSEAAHLAAWSAAEVMIRDHPIAGIGLGNFKREMPFYAAPGVKVDSIAHNMFIEVAAELGLPSLMIFVSIFVFAFLALGRIRKKRSLPPFLRDAATALRAGLIGTAIAGCFVSAEYQKTTWMCFALVACLTPLARSIKTKKANACAAAPATVVSAPSEEPYRTRTVVGSKAF